MVILQLEIAMNEYITQLAIGTSSLENAYNSTHLYNYKPTQHIGKVLYSPG